MEPLITKLHGVAAIGLLAAALAGCGGGGGYEMPAAPAVATEVPAAAGASSQAFTDYASSLAPDDRVEALGLNQLGDAKPVDDGAEPVLLS